MGGDRIALNLTYSMVSSLQMKVRPLHCPYQKGIFLLAKFFVTFAYTKIILLTDVSFLFQWRCELQM